MAFVFVYGTLRKSKYSKARKEVEVNGELRDKHGQAIARFDKKGTVIGDIILVSQMKPLDKRETGYRRRYIDPPEEFLHDLYAYQYEGDDFEEWPIVSGGDWHDR